MPDGEILRDVQQFVAQHPEGELWVCTGSTSAWGLAELAKLAPNRPVRVVMSKVTDAVSRSASPEDQQAAIAFLQRPDVSVQCWYQNQRDNLPKRSMHIKAFIADPTGPTPAALVGSANLTMAGLLHNQEAMVTANPHDAARLVTQVQEMRTRHGDQKQAVHERLSSPAGGRRSHARRAADAGERDTDQAQEKKGCLSSVAASVALAVAVVVTVALLLF